MNRNSDRSTRHRASSKLPGLCAVLLCGLALSACASTPKPAGPGVTPALAPDPFEPFNRAMLHVNDGFETVVAKPIDVVYRRVLPSFLRKGLSNAAENLTSPVTFLNDVLQGKPKRAGQTLVRFVMNSTFGAGGLLDVAAGEGIKPHSEDFGQTLAVWGVKNGPYLVLPFLGPTTVRDGIGLGIDTISDPTFWLIHDATASYSLYAGQLFIDYDDNRDDLENLRKSSIDFYSALRSSYLQNRQSQVMDGATQPGNLGSDILDSLPESSTPPK